MASITVEWNQWAPEVNFDNWNVYNATYATVTCEDGVFYHTYLQSKTSRYRSSCSTIGTINQTTGQIWYASYMVNASQQANWSCEFAANTYSRAWQTFQANNWNRWSDINVATTRNQKMFFPYCDTSVANMTSQAKAPIWINLTQMFGQGHEPNLEEFEALCRLNCVNLEEYQPYDAGTLVTWEIPVISPIVARRNILLNSPHVEEETSTSNGATITTDIKAPIKSIKTYFNPIQAGSGTPSPDNVRPISGWNDIQMVKCGKNLFNVRAQRSQCFPTITGNTTVRHYIPNTINPGASATNYLSTSNLTYSVSDNSVTVNCRSGYGLGYTFCLTPGETYTLSGLCDSEYHSIGIAFYTIDDVFIHYRENVQFPYTFTVDNNAYITLITFKSIGSGYSTNITYSNIQLEKGSVATNYEPYNGELFFTPPAEYAISPTTVTGYGVTWTVNSDGTVDYEGTPTSYTGVAPGIYYIRDPNEKIRISIYGDVDNIVFNALDIKDENNTRLGLVYEGYRQADIDFSQYENPYSIKISLKRSLNDIYMKGRCWVRITSSLDEIYGGYVDLVKGELVEEWMRYVFTGDETFYNTGTWVTSFFSAAAEQPYSGYCSHYPYAPYSRGKIGVMINEKTCTFDGNIYDASGWKQFCKDQYDNSTPVMVTYRIREPIRYSLTPQQLKTFVGTNNIYSSANGNTEIEYYTH